MLKLEDAVSLSLLLLQTLSLLPLLIKIPAGAGRGWRVVGRALGPTQFAFCLLRSEKKLSSPADLWAVGNPP